MRIRSIFTALVVAVMALPVAAQSNVGTFSLVPRVGVDVTNVSGNHVYAYGAIGTFSLKGKLHSDFTGGVEAMYQVLPRLAVSAGAMYAAEGCRYGDIEVGTGTTRAGINENRINLEYLQVPVMLRYYVAKGLSVNAGLRLGFLLSANHEFDAIDITYNEISGTREYGDAHSTDEDIKEACKKTTVAIPIGISYEYMNVVLDARYHFPLTKAFDSGVDGKVKGFTVTVGYKFDL